MAPSYELLDQREEDEEADRHPEFRVEPEMLIDVRHRASSPPARGELAPDRGIDRAAVRSIRRLAALRCSMASRRAECEPLRMRCT